MKKLLLTTSILALTLGGALAGDGKTFKSKVEVEPEITYFRNQEFQVDVFYHQFFRKPEAERDIRTGSGGGFAFNYIFARYFGIGIENTFTGNQNSAFYNLNGYAILRYPIESLRLAPYVLVGGGAGLGNDSYGYFNVGGGLEYRFTPHIGTFVDSRWFIGDTANGSNLRAGLRLAF